MSQQIPEQLSALMDGELARDETLFLMRRIGSDEGLVQRWAGYHVTRQVLRRQDVFVLPDSFSENILARLDAEPVLHVARGGRWLRWAGGGAIAASVAVVALMFSAPNSNPGGVSGEPLAASVNSNPAPAAPATLGAGDFRPPLMSPALDVQPASASTEGFSSSSAPMDPRLQSYLIRHYDAAANSGQSAMMPYVLLVVPPQQEPVDPAAEGTIQQR
ncbi:MAG TPA: sigma-E factor negative regulatory protein [Dokdonella sp.]|uniref:sigma-E factor negative regulatory protein n=1 Tax=Dokdonella sp. TaxID=2291710 RepID=UPI002D7ECAE1|nr:sigma-E factor negative regulatory protein [Dokdonella sp.]HET9034323.1 sigma-E factor negative regulatory protein [Dokdonella sp.]